MFACIPQAVAYTFTLSETVYAFRMCLQAIKGLDAMSCPESASLVITSPMKVSLHIGHGKHVPGLGLSVIFLSADACGG